MSFLRRQALKLPIKVILTNYLFSLSKYPEYFPFLKLKVLAFDLARPQCVKKIKAFVLALYTIL